MTFLMPKKLILLLSFLALIGVASAEKAVKVACIGNSITYGSLVDNREVNAYPVVLQGMLGPGYDVRNFGRPGATLLRKGHRPYNLQTQFEQALEFAPDIAIIKIGINDTDPSDWPHFRDFFAADYAALLDTLKAVNPEVRILISRLAPVTVAHPRFNAGTRQWRDSINILLENLAEARNLEFIDLGERLVDHPELLPDALHPNVAGARMMAQTAFEAITGNFGGLRMAPVYASGMVLQRDRPLTIRGHADAGERVSVDFAGFTACANADNRGRWEVKLPPMQAAEGLTMTVTAPSGKLVFDNVAVGEVWLASGQSNMEFTVASAIDLKDISADSLLRFFHMRPSVITNSRKWTEEQLAAVDSLNYFRTDGWVAVDGNTAPPLSAVAYAFARVIRDSLDVPVGIIANAQGGAPAEAWADIEVLQAKFPEVLADWRRNHYIQPWVQKRAGENTGTDSLGLTHRHPYEPAYLYAAGMKPLEGYPVQGVIWYQGESNAHNAEVHERLFPLVVESVRGGWNSPQMPVIFAQLSSLNRPSWAAFRDSQRRLANSMDNVYMAVTHDVGDSLDVHPRMKRPVGERMARQALRNVYGFNGVRADGPTPVRAYIGSSGEVVIKFANADGLATSDGGAPVTFEIAGPDGIYHPAGARIEGSDVIIDATLSPLQARYAWQPFTRANLINGDGLPASTFSIMIEQPQTAPEEGVDFGLSGCAGGFVGGEAIIAGGCNFPVNSLAPDSRKHFYKGIYRIDERGIERRASLPDALAYAASATVDAGVVIAGGVTPEGPSNRVWLITPEFTVLPLPELSLPVDNASAAAVGSKVYVVGGNVNGVPSNDIFMLDIDRVDKGWTPLRPFPGNPRTQPAVAASNGKIYVFGGFAAGDNPTLETGTLVYDPVRNRWKELPAPPADTSLGGGAAATMPDGRIVVAGGVNADIFLAALQATPANYLSHNPDWYRFNAKVMIFDPQNNSWTTIDGYDTARAGATLFPLDQNHLMLYGGEIKPRIRTPGITLITLPNP